MGSPRGKKDEMTKRIGSSRKHFKVDAAPWLPASGAFRADGRALLFHDSTQGHAEVRSWLGQVRNLAEATPTLVVFEPLERDTTNIARLPMELGYGFTVLLDGNEPFAFQLVVFRRNEASDLPYVDLPNGRCTVLLRRNLAAWDGTVLTAAYVEPTKEERLPMHTVYPYSDPSDLAYDNSTIFDLGID